MLETAQPRRGIVLTPQQEIANGVGLSDEGVPGFRQIVNFGACNILLQPASSFIGIQQYVFATDHRK